MAEVLICHRFLFDWQESDNFSARLAAAAAETGSSRNCLSSLFCDRSCVLELLVYGAVAVLLLRGALWISAYLGR
jgi:hypothetical protein